MEEKQATEQDNSNKQEAPKLKEKWQQALLDFAKVEYKQHGKMKELARMLKPIFPNEDVFDNNIETIKQILLRALPQEDKTAIGRLLLLPSYNAEYLYIPIIIFI